MSGTNGKSRVLSLTDALSKPKGTAQHQYVPAKVFHAFVASVIEYTDGLAKAIDAREAEIREMRDVLTHHGLYKPAPTEGNAE